VAEDLRRGQLRQVLPQYTLAETGIYAVMPQRRLVPPRVRAFVEFMQVQLAEPPPWERLE
jgi:DNA-binding transcriptional LysR family regulator